MLQLPVVRQRLYETSCRFIGIGRVRYSTGTPNKEVQTMIYQIHFGKRIAMLRRKANLSQADLAKKLDVTSQAVSKWECGKGEEVYCF